MGGRGAVSSASGKYGAGLDRAGRRGSPPCFLDGSRRAGCRAVLTVRAWPAGNVTQRAAQRGCECEWVKGIPAAGMRGGCANKGRPRVLGRGGPVMRDHGSSAGRRRGANLTGSPAPLAPAAAASAARRRKTVASVAANVSRSQHGMEGSRGEADQSGWEGQRRSHPRRGWRTDTLVQTERSLPFLIHATSGMSLRTTSVSLWLYVVTKAT